MVVDDLFDQLESLVTIPIIHLSKHVLKKVDDSAVFLNICDAHVEQ